MVSARRGDGRLTVAWVILTMGNRPEALAEAVGSVRRHCSDRSALLVVSNGGPREIDGVAPAEVLAVPDNLGIPGGRDLALRHLDADVVCFLDDDAHVTAGAEAAALALFERDPSIAVVAMRLIDECGTTARRHVPRVGAGSSDRGGAVATFLGGACAIRRTAYLEVGGYWSELRYGHEELDLAWRLIDAGYRVIFEPRAEVVHPRTEISRHAEGWRLTGRNRVWVARRNLPWPVAVVHVTAWLLIGTWRAPAGTCRRSYLAGWWSGWRSRWLPPVTRRAMRWRTVWHLGMFGRLPVV